MSGVRRSPRNSVNDRPSGLRLALRRQRRLLRPAGWVALASIVALMLMFAVHTAGLHAGSGRTLNTMRERLGAMTAASGLRVTNVVIEGRANTPEAMLREAIGVRKGDPILGFSLDDTRATIERIPWVEHVTVERRLPGTLVVNLQERRPYAIWQNRGKFVLVDRTGQVVTNQDVAQFRRLPLIVGQGAPNAAAELLDALRDRPALEEKVQASVRVGERRWNLRMTNGTDVMLPEGHEVAALDRLGHLQQDHDVLDRPLTAIDMRLPDRLVFRPKPDAGDGDVVPPIPPGSSSPATSPPATSLPPTSTPELPVIARKPT
ncbi:cell division protein FtsQ/DivIB [Rhodopila sp.]|uniref:cell division protein FtsQ/DivIB n=1 Tax=Rhodopila sp. TaxID=2480087 RepID=UPI003D0D9FB2